MMLIALMSIIAIGFAFGAGAQEGAATGEVDPKLSAPGQLPLYSEPTTLRISTYDNWYAPASYTLNLPTWQEIEKDTNVKVEWDVYPYSQSATIQQTMFASGVDLPDIVYGNMASNIKKYYKSGLILNLKPLWR